MSPGSTWDMVCPSEAHSASSPSASFCLIDDQYDGHLQVRDDGGKEEGLLQLADRGPQKQADGTDGAAPGYEASTALPNDNSLITQVDRALLFALLALVHQM